MKEKGLILNFRRDLHQYHLVDLTRSEGTVRLPIHLILKFQERPPPVPPSRSYTVRGNSKIAYPQARFMRQSYPGII